MAQDAPIRVEVSSQLGEAVRLEAEWRALFARAVGPSFFQSPDWLLPYWAHAPTEQPQLWTAYAGDGRLVGLAALAKRGQQLGLLGGTAAAYLGPLIDPDALGVSDVLLDHLSEQHLASVSLIELDRLEAHSPLFSARIPRGVVAQWCEADVCPVLPLRANGRSETVLPPGFEQHTHTLHRRADRAGGLENVLLRSGAIERGLDRLFELHAASAERQGRRGGFGEAWLRDFLRAVVRRAAISGALRLLELRLGGETVALALGFCTHGRMLFYASGCSARHAQLCPDRLAVLGLLERAIAEHAYELDFLRGVEPFKYDWGAHNRSIYRLCLSSRAVAHRSPKVDNQPHT